MIFLPSPGYIPTKFDFFPVFYFQLLYYLPCYQKFCIYHKYLCFCCCFVLVMFFLFSSGVAIIERKLSQYKEKKKIRILFFLWTEKNTEKKRKQIYLCYFLGKLSRHKIVWSLSTNCNCEENAKSGIEWKLTVAGSW